jgi:hemerythrin
MPVQWKDAYKVGDVEIDQQHQEIFKKANAFLEASDSATLTECAMGFFHYTREHFSHEESLMRELHFPAIAGHIQQHNDLIERLNRIAADISKKELTHKDLESFLNDWLLVHIRAYDTKLAAYISAKK